MSGNTNSTRRAFSRCSVYNQKYILVQACEMNKYLETYALCIHYYDLQNMERWG